MTFEGVSRLTSRELQDFLSFKKSVPEKVIFMFSLVPQIPNHTGNVLWLAFERIVMQIDKGQ